MKTSVANEEFSPNECPAYSYSLRHMMIPLKSNNNTFLGLNCNVAPVVKSDC